jgi:3-oxoacyl-[acyl-carrier protein] reductase
MSKHYLFAGASSAIAQAALRMAHAEGITVSGISTKDLGGLGYDHTYQVADYSKASLPELDTPIHGLVYFPGTINLKPLHRTTEAEFLEEYRINALGAVGVIQQYLSNLKSAGNPSIVLMSTVAAAQGMTFHSSIAMAKGAIEGLALALAAELAPTMRVNAVAPSLTASPLADKLINSPEKLEASNKRHPLRRIGQPDDIANAVVFLLSDKAAWITGQVMHVDGGMSTVRTL